MNESGQRAAFEAWFIADVNGSGADLDQDENDTYEINSTQLAFEAWQAATEHAKKTMCNRN